MGSSIVLKLLNVTQYYRNQKNRKWYLPFGYGAEDIELNKITLHIYQGEALALILHLIEGKLYNQQVFIMEI